MYRIIDGKGTGKTGRLFLIAKEQGAVIVCKNVAKARERAYAYGITGLEFMSYGEAIEQLYICPQTIVIDELEEFIKYWIHEDANLIGYTLSNED